MGPYEISTSKLGLLTCDDIIQSSVTALFLDFIKNLKQFRIYIQNTISPIGLCIIFT